MERLANQRKEGYGEIKRETETERDIEKYVEGERVRERNINRDIERKEIKIEKEKTKTERQR